MGKNNINKKPTKLRRLFLKDIPGTQREIFLEGDEKRYINNVLRLGVSDSLILFDGSGWEYHADIIKVEARQVILKVGQKVKGKRESSLKIDLGIGLLKAQKMDLVIQKVTELGVNRIFPIVTSRTIPSLTADRLENRSIRWRKIAREASRQCGRARVAAVQPVLPLADIIEQGRGSDLALLFSANTDNSLREIAPRGFSAPHHLFVLVGPEGGFAPEEEQRALENGFLPTGLGPRTLRAETAAIMAVGLVQFQFGDMGAHPIS